MSNVLAVVYYATEASSLLPMSQGMHTGGKEYKVAAFADDALLFLSNPDHFRVISNLKIKNSKYHTLIISLDLLLAEHNGIPIVLTSGHQILRN